MIAFTQLPLDQRRWQRMNASATWLSRAVCEGLYARSSGGPVRAAIDLTILKSKESVMSTKQSHGMAKLWSGDRAVFR